MKLETKYVVMRYDKAFGRAQLEGRKFTSLNNMEPYAPNAFTLHHIVGASVSY